MVRVLTVGACRRMGKKGCGSWVRRAATYMLLLLHTFFASDKVPGSKLSG